MAKISINSAAKVAILLAVSSSLSFSACSVSKNDEMNVNKTGLGAATGAALGAGLGAVVGSATGSAGEGLVIGSAAGAVAGGLVGSQLDRQDQQIANQKEVNARHEAQLSEQGRQIQELKEAERYEIPRKNRSSRDNTVSSKQFPAPVKPGNMSAKNEVPEKRARLEAPITLQPEKSLTAKEKKPSPVKEVTKKESSGGGLPPAAKTAATESNVTPAPAKAVATKGKTDAPHASLAKDGNCGEAESEAGRARNASSDADKLFYFRRALRLCPKEPSYHVEMGKVFNTIGRKEDAKFEFNKAVELDPENKDAQDELSVMMLDNSY